MPLISWRAHISYQFFLFSLYSLGRKSEASAAREDRNSEKVLCVVIVGARNGTHEEGEESSQRGESKNTEKGFGKVVSHFLMRETNGLKLLLH